MKKSQNFTPTLFECASALDSFLQAFERYSAGNSRELALRCSLDAVWEAGRRYQAQLEAEEQTTPMNSAAEIMEAAV